MYSLKRMELLIKYCFITKMACLCLRRTHVNILPSLALFTPGMGQNICVASRKYKNMNFAGHYMIILQPRHISESDVSSITRCYVICIGFAPVIAIPDAQSTFSANKYLSFIHNIHYPWQRSYKGVLRESSLAAMLYAEPCFLGAC